MKPHFKVEKRAEGWAVVGRGSRTIYWNSNYAKVIGVHDFITEWGGFRSVNKDAAVESEPQSTPTQTRPL